MTPLTREETERLRRLADWQDALCENCDRGDDEAECICLDKPPHEYPIRPETLRELLRGYEAWRDGIEKIEKERERLECIAETEITEESLRLSEGGIHWQKAIAGIEANAISRALDALRAGKRK